MIIETETQNTAAPDGYWAERKELSVKKTVKWLFAAAVALAITQSGLTAVYVHDLSEKLHRSRLEGFSDTAYLRSRIRDLESTWRETVQDVLAMIPEADTSPARGEETASHEESREPASSDGREDTASPDTEGSREEVTLPTHESPAAPSMGEEEGTAPAPSYVVAEHRGIIGLFDHEGRLLRTVNVFVMTLPEADRTALTAGIPVSSLEEGEALLEALG